MQLSTVTAEDLLDHLIGVAAWPTPDAWWVQLHTGDPGPACTDNVSAVGSRRRVTASRTDRSVTTTSAVWASWPSAADDEEITHYSVWSEASVGTPLWYGQLVASVPVTASQLVTVVVEVST